MPALTKNRAHVLPSGAGLQFLSVLTTFFFFFFPLPKSGIYKVQSCQDGSLIILGPRL